MFSWCIKHVLRSLSKHHTWLQLPVRQDRLQKGGLDLWYCYLNSVWSRRLFCSAYVVFSSECVACIGDFPVSCVSLKVGVFLSRQRIESRCYLKSNWCSGRVRNITGPCRGIIKWNESTKQERELRTVLICQQSFTCLVSWGLKFLCIVNEITVTVLLFWEIRCVSFKCDWTA